ncbi:hypothetical protein BKI52_37580 [marine bacterium AO1-C]|nr:hypothetical protein BKI52_37580 [marine bacterium AO1-C]
MKQILVIYGPPYSGSSHTGLQIAEHYNGIPLSLGDLIRKEIREKSKMGKLLPDYLQKGQVMPQMLIEQLILESFVKHQSEDLLVFINFPKNQFQAEAITEIGASFGFEMLQVVALVIQEQMIIERMQKSNTKDVEAIWEKLEGYYTNVSFVMNHYEGLGKLSVIDFSEDVPDLVKKISEITGL